LSERSLILNGVLQTPKWDFWLFAARKSYASWLHTRLCLIYARKIVGTVSVYEIMNPKKRSDPKKYIPFSLETAALLSRLAINSQARAIVPPQ
jgi:hypothetical protein